MGKFLLALHWNSEILNTCYALEKSTMKPRTKFLNLRLSEDEFAALKNAASREVMPVATFIRRASLKNASGEI